MDVLSVSLDGDNHKSSRENEVVNECKRSCMECLSCPNNKNPQFKLKLVWPFNRWEELKNVKWIDFNWICDLKK